MRLARLVSLALAVAAAGCFTPDLGDGAVVCGSDGSCPPSYSCHTDQRCWRATGRVAGDGGGDLASSAPADLAGADLLACAACAGKGCGSVVGCGGIATCGPACGGGQTCGGGGTANVCAAGSCQAKTCQKNKDCGLISDGCSTVLDCGGCSGNKTCGGGGPNQCG